jgi:hypothetical protein
VPTNGQLAEHVRDKDNNFDFTIRDTIYLHQRPPAAPEPVAHVFQFGSSLLMDFLKSAVASAIAKGPPFPYTFGDKVDLDPSIWTLYNGTRRVSHPFFTLCHPLAISSQLNLSDLQEDGSNCSIFSFDIAANKSSLPLAKNALKKLRTLRHPGVIKVLDTVEVRLLHNHRYTCNR